MTVYCLRWIPCENLNSLVDSYGNHWCQPKYFSVQNLATVTVVFHPWCRLLQGLTENITLLFSFKRFRSRTDVSIPSIEAVRSFQKSVKSYLTTRRHIPVCILCMVTQRPFPRVYLKHFDSNCTAKELGIRDTVCRHSETASIKFLPKPGIEPGTFRSSV